MLRLLIEQNEIIESLFTILADLTKRLAQYETVEEEDEIERQRRNFERI